MDDDASIAEYESQFLAAFGDNPTMSPAEFYKNWGIVDPEKHNGE